MTGAITRTALATAALLLLAACSDHDPAGPGAEMGELQIHASVNSPTIATLVLEVTAPDLADPFVFNFELDENGVAAGDFLVPAGGKRTITVRAFDVSGIQTHEGRVTVHIRPGPNPLVRITLRPLAGHQRIEVILGSFTVSVEPTEATLAVGQTLQIEATVTDTDGSVVAGTNDVVWATDAPAVATVSVTGLVSAKLDGSARIVASFGGVAAAAQVTVATLAGQRLAFVSNRDGNAEIYVMNADGSAQMNLTNHAEDDFFSSFGQDPWSPDGSKLAFERESEIYVMNANGSGQMNLTNNAAIDSEPAWSPDGSKIAFRSNRGGSPDIFIMNALDGSEQTNLTLHPAEEYSPAWSPDGSRIAFSCNCGALFETGERESELFVMNADGSGRTLLAGATGTSLSLAPMWSPDGSRIAFTTFNDIHVINADGTGRVFLEGTGALDDRPQWSPDGSMIAFSSTRDGNREVYLANPEGGVLVTLTNHPGNDYGPVWSPDGSRIVFETDRDGSPNLDIYVMNADGTGQTNLTTHPAHDTSPRWAPLP